MASKKLYNNAWHVLTALVIIELSVFIIMRIIVTSTIK